MIRKSVSSSNLKSVGYDVTTKTLEIEFLDGGIYEYKNVSPENYTDLMNAASHGQYFHKFIKDRHATVKLR